MKVTFGEILEIPALRGAKVVTGKNGLDREIRSVTVAEVPDAADWLAGGELVVTTGYFIREDEAFQKKWLTSLIEGGAAALAVKTSRFLGGMPLAMVELALERQFPLVELSHDVKWPDLIEAVYQKVSNTQRDIIRRTEEIHRKLTRLVMEGKGFSAIAQTLAELVDNLIVVEDMHLGALALGCPGSMREAAEELFTARMAQGYKRQFRQTGYYRETAEAAGREMHRQGVAAGEREFSQITIPIVADNSPYGFISLLEFGHPANELDVIALEQGATAIALELMKSKLLYENNIRARRHYFEMLLDGATPVSPKGEGLDQLFFDTTRPAVVILLELGDLDFLSDAMQQDQLVFRRQQELSRMVEKEVFARDEGNFVLFQENLCTILYHFTERSSQKIHQETLALCGRITAGIRQTHPGMSYYIGVGGIHTQFCNIKKGYEEAKKALEIQKLFVLKNETAFYNNLGIYRFLSLIENKSEVISFCNDTIGSLIEHDRVHGENDCAMFERYILNNGSITKTAKECKIHPNTLTYRIKRVGKILGVDIGDAKTRFNLYLALKIKSLYNL